MLANTHISHFTCERRANWEEGTKLGLIVLVSLSRLIRVFIFLLYHIILLCGDEVAYR